jgi:hypothetical protein
MAEDGGPAIWMETSAVRLPSRPIGAPILARRQPAAVHLEAYRPWEPPVLSPGLQHCKSWEPCMFHDFRALVFDSFDELELKCAEELGIRLEDLVLRAETNYPSN